MGIPADYNDKDYVGIISSIFPVHLMLSVSKAQKASHECVGNNQKETIQINHEKGTIYLFTATGKPFSKEILLENPH
jgi:hypothetical protein